MMSLPKGDDWTGDAYYGISSQVVAYACPKDWPDGEAKAAADPNYVEVAIKAIFGRCGKNVSGSSQLLSDKYWAVIGFMSTAKGFSICDGAMATPADSCAT